MYVDSFGQAGREIFSEEERKREREEGERERKNEIVISDPFPPWPLTFPNSACDTKDLK